MDKARLEAFSDGVIAIAITLLVLEIDVPAPGSGRLGHQLAEQWPSYAAYVVSFLTIGVIWINHHAMLRRIKAVEHSVLALNLLLLLVVGILPWTTALLAAYLREGDGQHLAAAVYGGSFFLLGVAFYAMNRHILVTKDHLLHDHLRGEEADLVRRRNRAGLIPYLVATAVAPLSSYLTLGICGAVAVYYALPRTTAEPTA
jgi:uncharacterized membrane protein